MISNLKERIAQYKQLIKLYGTYTPLTLDSALITLSSIEEEINAINKKLNILLKEMKWE